MADGLVIQDRNGKYSLTNKGIKLVDEIDKEPHVLSAEKLDLFELSKKLTEDKIKQISQNWRRFYAED